MDVLVKRSFALVLSLLCVDVSFPTAGASAPSTVLPAADWQQQALVAPGLWHRLAAASRAHKARAEAARELPLIERPRKPKPLPPPRLQSLPARPTLPLYGAELRAAGDDQGVPYVEVRGVLFVHENDLKISALTLRDTWRHLFDRWSSRWRFRPHSLRDPAIRLSTFFWVRGLLYAITWPFSLPLVWNHLMQNASDPQTWVSAGGIVPFLSIPAGWGFHRIRAAIQNKKENAAVQKAADRFESEGYKVDVSPEILPRVAHYEQKLADHGWTLIWTDHRELSAQFDFEARIVFLNIGWLSLPYDGSTRGWWEHRLDHLLSSLERKQRVPRRFRLAA
jgi:hypothetical protein